MTTTDGNRWVFFPSLQFSTWKWPEFFGRSAPRRPNSSMFSNVGSSSQSDRPFEMASKNCWIEYSPQLMVGTWNYYELLFFWGGFLRHEIHWKNMGLSQNVSNLARENGWTFQRYLKPPPRLWLILGFQKRTPYFWASNKHQPNIPQKTPRFLGVGIGSKKNHSGTPAKLISKKFWCATGCPIYFWVCEMSSCHQPPSSLAEKLEIQDTLGSAAESAPRAAGASVALGPRGCASCPREGVVQRAWKPPASCNLGIREG